MRMYNEHDYVTPNNEISPKINQASNQENKP